MLTKAVGSLANHIRIKVTKMYSRFAFVSYAEGLVCITSKFLCTCTNMNVLLYM